MDKNCATFFLMGKKTKIGNILWTESWNNNLKFLKGQKHI